MNHTDKEKSTATALHNLTKRGVISWEAFQSDAVDLPRSFTVPEDRPVFAAIHRDMNLYLYDGGHAESDRDGESPTLAIVDPERDIGTAFAGLDELDDLYVLVEFECSRVSEWMDNVIDDGTDVESNGLSSSRDAAPSWAETDEDDVDVSSDSDPTSESSAPDESNGAYDEEDDPEPFTHESDGV